MIGIDYFATTGQVIMISTWGLLRKYEKKFSHKKNKKENTYVFSSPCLPCYILLTT